MRPKISIVIPVFNEEENIKPLAKSIEEGVGDISYEVVLVDDGSTDNTVKEILALDDEKIKLVKLRKNFGQSNAMMAGLDYAEADYIVTMDGDLQNDPSDIPAMLKKIEEEEWGLVAGIRAKRQDGMFLRKIPSKIANRIIQKSTGIKIKDYGCTLKIFEYDIAKDLGLYGELHRFIPVLAHLQGARIAQMDVKHHARRFGKSKYGINRTFKVIADLLLMIFLKKYLQKPIHLFGTMGLFVFFVGAAINMYMVVLKLMGEDIWGKPMLILGVLLSLGGIQLITFGIISEMQVRTYYESQGKRPYKVKNVFVGKNKV